METVMDNNKSRSFKEKFISFWKVIGKALRNKTFLYIVRRTLSSIFTLILLIAIVTALIRLLPDEKFYDISTYNKLFGNGSETRVKIAERYKISQLYTYGICDLNGKRISVLQNIFTYIYHILPIYKEIPVRWSTDYSEVKLYWKGFCYLGRSANGKYVVDILKGRIGISFEVSIITVIFTYIFAIPLGIGMAKKPGGTVDKIGNAFIVLNYAIPGLVFYLTMNMLFGDTSGALGKLGFGFFYDEKKKFLTLFPPIFCSVFLAIPGVSIWVRRFMIDELTSDYVKFARSKGISESTIMYKHVFRNAMIPLVRNIPSTFIFAIVGSYYVEYIWKIPGTGILLITSLQGTHPDVAMIQSLTVVYAALSMLAFLLGDLVTVFFDPRIKLED